MALSRYKTVSKLLPHSSLGCFAGGSRLVCATGSSALTSLTFFFFQAGWLTFQCPQSDCDALAVLSQPSDSLKWAYYEENVIQETNEFFCLWSNFWKVSIYFCCWSSLDCMATDCIEEVDGPGTRWLTKEFNPKQAHESPGGHSPPPHNLLLNRETHASH